MRGGVPNGLEDKIFVDAGGACVGMLIGSGESGWSDISAVSRTRSFVVTVFEEILKVD